MSARPICCRIPHPLDDESVRACLRNKARTSAPGRFRLPTGTVVRTIPVTLDEDDAPKSVRIELDLTDMSTKRSPRRVPDGRPLVQLGISLAEPTRDRLKAEAIAGGISASEIIEDLLTEHFAKESR